MDEDFDKLVAALNEARARVTLSQSAVEGVSLSLGQLLRRMREDIGLSLAQMAAQVGVSKSCVENYERGHRVVSVAVAKKIREIWKLGSMKAGLK